MPTIAPATAPELLYLLHSDPSDLEAVLEGMRPADIAEALRDLPADAAARVMAAMPFAMSVQVFDDHLIRVDQNDVTTVDPDGYQIAVDLQSGLGAGTYTVSWRVSSTDTHPVSSTFTYSVGAASTVSGAPPPTGSDPAAGILLAVARGLGYVGLALGPGALLVLLLLWPTGMVPGAAGGHGRCDAAPGGACVRGAAEHDVDGPCAVGHPVRAVRHAPYGAALPAARGRCDGARGGPGRGGGRPIPAAA